MSLDRCAVERKHKRIFAGFGEGCKNSAPSFGLGPAIEAIVDRRVRPVFIGAIAPATARLQHKDDTANDAPVIVAHRTLQSARQMRRDAPPLLVAQPKQSSAHGLPPNQFEEDRITTQDLGTDPRHVFTVV